jgi:hypothetical protein
MPISQQQARDLARLFLDLSNSLTKYRLDRWAQLSKAQHRDVADVAYTLHNYSDDFVTTAVGIALQNIQNDLQAIKQATAKALKVVKTVNTVKSVLAVAAAVVSLGGAIASKNPAAIASSAADLFTQANKLLPKKKKPA